ncbi:hypothetical protein scyTo_0025861 [Scyliorhinus torazame]|uniref:Uncharacterized protein n=2 Tax=Scyliorhinus torazame TaxID=75743 RepID=A0A401QIJ2_SCYTO|nr:hypothetical protein [Scyliorhinus torazame]
MGREPSPYSRLPATSEGPKPSLLRELAKRHEVKVKEERKEEHDLMAGGVAPPGFESTAQLQRAHVPGGAAHTLHALHSLPVPLAVIGQVNGLGVLERNRVLAGPFLGVGHHGMASSAGGERLPHYGWDPFRDSWREACRGPEVPSIHQRYPVPQHQPQPRFYEPERAYRERQLLREFVPEGLLAETRREQEAAGLLEEQLLLREEYDHRARLLSFLGSPHPPHHPYPRVSPSLVHQSGLLSKTPPMATLGAPPPLISSTGVRPGSPATRATPLSANELRDLSAYSHKDRDSR